MHCSICGSCWLTSASNTVNDSDSADWKGVNLALSSKFIRRSDWPDGAALCIIARLLLMSTPYQLLHTLHDAHSDSVNCVAFCPHGDHLASGSDDCRLVIWNIPNGKAVWAKKLNSPVLSILWDSHRHASIICGCQNGTLLIWNNFQVRIGQPWCV